MDKRQWNAPSNPVLGVMVNLASCHRPDGYATVATLRARIDKVLTLMRKAAAANYLSPAQAGKLKGLLGFTLLPVMFRFGRAATQPLTQRQHKERGACRWTPPLRAMATFFERTLPTLPELRVYMRPRRMRPVLIYTDASYVVVRGQRRLWLGMYVFDPVSFAEFYSRLLVPASFYKYFAADKRTYIAQGELLVAVAAYYTLPELLRERAVMHFIDNMVALSAMVNGYASKADCAILVNTFHEAVLRLRVYLWAEWVPSAANIGDWPSRPGKVHLVPRSAKWVDLVLPPVQAFADMLA